MTRKEAQSIGGHNRARNLSPEERTAIARKGGFAKWEKRARAEEQQQQNS